MSYKRRIRVVAVRRRKPFFHPAEDPCHNECNKLPFLQPYSNSNNSVRDILRNNKEEDEE